MQEMFVLATSLSACSIICFKQIMYVAALSVTMLAAKSRDANLVPVSPATAAGAQFPTHYPARCSISSNKDCALACVACCAEAIHQSDVRIPASGVTYSSLAASLCSA